ncbi:MAG: hypothetical protein HC769_01880 [Cyanobacteria bacterium CRU_2_1]|nr:hypothetical protein [Cyanobacteria bacterium RU_5_0]NJR57707.1 hypothetical protein [Cyanobacteria bacterium CRU_2_1]
MDKLNFILKVLLLSAAIAVVIRYVAPSLAIPATLTNTLIAVFLPTVIMAIALGWRWMKAED